MGAARRTHASCGARPARVRALPASRRAAVPARDGRIPHPRRRRVRLDTPHIIGPDVGTAASLFAAALYPSRLRSLVVGSGGTASTIAAAVAAARSAAVTTVAAAADTELECTAASVRVGSGADVADCLTYDAR